MKKRAPYRGRLAPSPTGLLHLGHAQTFWTAYQRALAAGGALALRNEDLDPERSRPEFVRAMLEDLRWLGIRWQEGPDVGGAFAPYTQSERRGFYLEAWRKLAREGWIYPCPAPAGIWPRRPKPRMMRRPFIRERADREHADRPTPSFVKLRG